MDWSQTIQHMNTQHQAESWTIILKKNEENNKHNIGEKGRAVNRNLNQKDNDLDSVVRMRYGRIL